MISIRLVVEFDDDSVELVQATNFVHPGDRVQYARTMLEKIGVDAEAWLAVRERPADPQKMGD